MHLAHQQLFSKLDENGAIVVIQTSYANLSPFTNRTDHTSYPLFYYPLENIKHLSGKEFILLLKEEFKNLQKIVVGYDFHFGYKAAYGTDDLKKLFDGSVVVVDEYKLDDIAIHSRVIREYLRNGNLNLANRFLGYNYKLNGITIKGQGLGSKQFVPTINIDVKDFLIPNQGIYITKTTLHETSYNSVSFIGHRVTTDGKFAVETHIIDENFNQTVPAVVAIEFIEKIRDNQKFETYEALKEQIVDDIKKTKEWFYKNEKC
jgi:riboflavin kinase/FMN adenylyltransferase